MRYRLLFLSGPLAGRVREVGDEEAEILVGRDPSAHIVCDPDERSVSRLHAVLLQDAGGLLLRDLDSTAFDNSKIKRLVPDYEARISFAEGIRKSIAWYDERPEKQVPDASVNSLMNRLIKAYERATEKFPQN